MNTATNYANSLSANFPDDISFLKKNVEEHPESAFARFMLLNYYNKNKNPEFENLAKQTVLYFNNPHWLRFQLNLSVKENYSVEQEYSHSSVPTIQTENEGSKPEIESINETSSEEAVFHKPDNTIDVKEESKNINPSELIGTNDAFDAQEKNEINQIENEGEIKNVNSSEPEVTNDTIDVQEKKEINQIESEDEIENINSPESEETNDTIDVKENGLEDNAKIEIASELEDEKDQTLNPISNTSDLTPNIELPAFEPLHTVDYFASQGIKIKEEALLNDKLGKQMKSFTDWLKSMKKLHPGKLPEQNEVIEKIIQASAEESNADADVLTEAMAEVLLKQNKREKAVAMYQKLSLINPSKSAYFAAKIESIKNQ